MIKNWKNILRPNAAIRCGISLLALFLIFFFFNFHQIPSAQAAGATPPTPNTPCYGSYVTGAGSANPQPISEQGTWNSSGQCVALDGQVLSGPGVVVTNGTVPNDDFCNSASTCISSVVYVFTVGLMNIFAYIGGYIFDFAVQVTLNSNSYALSLLTTAWTSVRDIANIVFIFILVYLAFTIMFQAETHNTMRTLATVVIMALLINFSFFITRFVIDGGNLLAVEFYNAIPITQTVGQAAPNSILATGSTIGANAIGASTNNVKDLTWNIMQALQVQNILNTQSFKTFNQQNGFLTVLITLCLIYVAVGAILAILAVIFLTVGIKFLVRLVVLWFAIIAAPLAFAARALSANKKAAEFYQKWQGMLIEYTFYPAIFLFTFLLINFMMGSLSICTPATNGTPGGAESCGLVPAIFTDLNNTSTNGIGSLAAGIANVAIRLGLIVVLFYFALEISKRVASEGSEFVSGVTGWVNEKVSGGIRRAGGLAYQQSVSRAAAGADKALDNTRFGTSWLGYRLRNVTTRPAAEAKFGGARSYTEFARDVNKERVEREEKRERIERNEALGEVGELRGKKNAADTYQKYSDLNLRKIGELPVAERNELDTLNTQISDLEHRQQSLNTRKNTGETLSPVEETALSNITRQLESDRKRKEELEKGPKILSQSEERELIELERRFRTPTGNVAAPPKLTAEEENRLVLAEEKIKKLDAKGLERINRQDLISLVHYLTSKQLEDLLKSDTFPQSYKDELKKEWGARGTMDKPFLGGYGSKDNGINKFDKTVDELRTLSNKTTIGINLQRQQLKSMKEVLNREQDSLDSRRRAAEAELQKARDTYRNAENEKDASKKKTPPEIAALKSEQLQAQVVVDNYRKMNEELKKVVDALKEVPQHMDPRDRKEYASGDIRDKQDNP